MGSGCAFPRTFFLFCLSIYFDSSKQSNYGVKLLSLKDEMVASYVLYMRLSLPRVPQVMFCSALH